MWLFFEDFFEDFFELFFEDFFELFLEDFLELFFDDFLLLFLEDFLLFFEDFLEDFFELFLLLFFELLPELPLSELPLSESQQQLIALGAMRSSRRSMTNRDLLFSVFSAIAYPTPVGDLRGASPRRQGLIVVPIAAAVPEDRNTRAKKRKRVRQRLLRFCKDNPTQRGPVAFAKHRVSAIHPRFPIRIATSAACG